MQEEVFDQNDGSESAADESGAKKKRKGVLYIISASAVEGRLLVTRNTEGNHQYGDQDR